MSSLRRGHIDRRAVGARRDVPRWPGPMTVPRWPDRAGSVERSDELSRMPRNPRRRGAALAEADDRFSGIMPIQGRGEYDDVPRAG